MALIKRMPQYRLVLLAHSSHGDATSCVPFTFVRLFVFVAPPPNTRNISLYVVVVVAVAQQIQHADIPKIKRCICIPKDHYIDYVRLDHIICINTILILSNWNKTSVRVVRASVRYSRPSEIDRDFHANPVSIPIEQFITYT